MKPADKKNFVAIDFETANYYRDSACSVALVRVMKGKIVDRFVTLIKPPYRNFVFTYLHGISWADVKHAPEFGELWPEVVSFMRGAKFVVAHNASFDRSVLNACCRTHGIDMPDIEFRCTMRIARDVWDIYPTRLPNVCEFLDIPLHHHNALSDAEACARIMIEVFKKF
jgi:DNA polymerase-3 subunit epsilon